MMGKGVRGGWGCNFRVAWIKEMQCIYTMDYYSVIKAFSKAFM